MNYFTDGLTESQLDVLNLIGPLMSKWGFYLVGGTALTIYFRHRRSIDLDWFTQEQIVDTLTLAQTIRDAGIPFTTTQTAPGTLHGSVESVRVSFMEYRYHLLQPLNHWSKPDVSLAALDDLGCMKLSAIAQRGSKKDFLDVYALCTQHRPLEEFLSLYQRKFGVVDISPVLYGLVYFDDADEERTPEMMWDLNWDLVKNQIRIWVKEISK